jgi:hypothetical protein
LIEVFAWETEAGLAVHVLNYTNPNVELLRAAKNLPFRAAGGSIEFTIPSIGDYEVAALYSR